MKDQQLIKDLLAALLAQVDAGTSLSAQQKFALKNYWTRYEDFLHHHHSNEEDIAFPYLSKVKKCASSAKQSADHEAILAQLATINKMVEGVTSGSSPPSAEASSLSELSTLFIEFDKTLVEHYMEEEQLIPAMRRAITPKENAKYITNPIVSRMGVYDRGQYFSKLDAPALKLFMKQERIPFFVKWIFASNVKKYNKTYVHPVQDAINEAKNATAAAKPALAA